eukprot:gene5335-10667_t
MRRRGIGVGAIKNKQLDDERFKQVGKSLKDEHIAHVREQIELFRVSLQEFASKYKKNINSDPEFRHHFHKMCDTIGVDPLASNKGFWANVLGVGDFYYELGVIIIQITLQTRSENGGIISMTELLHRIKSSKIESRKYVTDEDIKRAVKKINTLGNGFQIIETHGRCMIVSVPMELNNDHELLLSVAEDIGYITQEMFTTQRSWRPERFQNIIQALLLDGMIWIDEYQGSVSYYFPCLLDE